MDTVEQASDLVRAAGAHADALAEISSRTAARLLVITDGLEIGHLPAVLRSIGREHWRADLFDALARDLACLDGGTPASSRTRSAAVGAPPRMGDSPASTGTSAWMALIALRQWQIHRYFRHHRALRSVAVGLLPELQASVDPAAQSAAARLSAGLAATLAASRPERAAQLRRDGRLPAHRRDGGDSHG